MQLSNKEDLIFGEHKNAMVSWSGGRDSTLLLIKLLETTDKNIHAITIESDQLEARNIQREYMNILHKELSERFRPFEWDIVRIDLPGRVGVRGLFGQCLTWLTTLPLYLGQEEDLYIGYVRGDDVWHIRSEMFDIYNKIVAVSEKRGKLIFPLEWATKDAVFDGLKEFGYLDKTWFCQDKGPKPCGVCASCNTDMMYKFLLEHQAQAEKNILRELRSYDAV